MKRLVLGTAVAGGSAFAFRRLAGEARKMHDHCRDMIAGRQAAEPTESRGCGFWETTSSRTIGGDHRVNKRLQDEARASD